MQARVLPLLATLLTLPTLAIAAPTGTVILRNGTKFEGVEYEVRGKKVKVTLRFGERIFDMSEIRDFIPETDADDEAAVRDTGPSLQDWQTRVKLTPPEGWEVAPATLPLERVRLLHTEYDASLTVTTRPATGPWQPPATKRAPRDVTVGIEKAVGLFYGVAPKLRVDSGTLFGCPVYRSSASGVLPYGASRGEERTLVESRFRRFGLEYAITLTVGKADAGAIKHDIDAAFESFSFLPALAVEDRFYGDYARGFSLALPSAEWKKLISAFHATRPLTVTTSDGRGVVRVEIYPGESDAGKTVSAMLTKREGASRHFKKLSQEEATQRGYPIVSFSFDDFRTHGKKMQHYEGFAAVAQSSVIVFNGISPLSDEDAKKIAGEVRSILKSVELYDVSVQRVSMSKEESALRYISQGYALAAKKNHAEAIQRYSDAIAEDDGIAIAFYLRAQAQKGRGQFKAYEADIARADELDPSAGYGADLSGLSREEAKAAERRKDWASATTLYSRSYQGTKSPKDLKSMVTNASKLWGEYRKKKDYRGGVSDLEKRFRRLRSQPECHKLLAKVYNEAGQSLLREKQKGKAKGMASKLRKLGKREKVKRYVDDAAKLDQSISRTR